LRVIWAFRRRTVQAMKSNEQVRSYYDSKTNESNKPG
jgi:hypothetical protein